MVTLLDVFPCTLFPAHAGVIPLERQYEQAKAAFPRTRGGDPA